MEIAEGNDNNWRSLLEPPEKPAPPTLSPDPLQALYGSGKTLWSDEHTDEYVARLRDGWD